MFEWIVIARAASLAICLAVLLRMCWTIVDAVFRATNPKIVLEYKTAVRITGLVIALFAWLMGWLG